MHRVFVGGPCSTARTLRQFSPRRVGVTQFKPPLDKPEWNCICRRQRGLNAVQRNQQQNNYSYNIAQTKNEIKMGLPFSRSFIYPWGFFHIIYHAEIFCFSFARLSESLLPGFHFLESAPLTKRPCLSVLSTTSTFLKHTCG